MMAPRLDAEGPPDAGREARRAEALGASLPPLLVAARRVAMTVAQGVHGRRRVGQGDSFWQFRSFLPGDQISRIDWRQSAKSDRVFVRETEWEAAQTVCLWADGSPSMHWRSELAPVTKAVRARLLLLAFASLLLRGGERARLMQSGAASLGGREALETLAHGLAASAAGDGPAASLPAPSLSAPSLPAPSLPPPLPLPRHATAVLFGDFLSPLADVQAALARLAAVPVSVHVLQVIDPAERALPFQGRIRFTDLEDAGQVLIPHVESLRGAYAERFARHLDGLAQICRGLGFSFASHATDQPPETALLALYVTLAAQRALLQ
ncbi:MAG: DUF58 domain-containing protein [Acetobacteraceae bacterium]